MIFHEAKVQFEVEINYGGNYYLVIFGRHINGYFCAIPNWGVGCEMAEPEDIFYNTERLQGTGKFNAVRAKALAKEIYNASKVFEEEMLKFKRLIKR